MKVETWFVFLTISLFSSLYILGQSHELAHKEICESFGGKAKINGIEADYNYVWMSTTCYLPLNISESAYYTYKLANTSGEWTYTLNAVIITMFFCVLLIYLSKAVE